LGGGWVADLESRVQSPRSRVQAAEAGATNVQPSTFNLQPSTFIVHGENDEVFPLSEAQRVVGCFESKGLPVETKVLAGQGHGLGANRLLIFRHIGEYILARFKGPGALREYRSILQFQAGAKPLWLYWLPALAWVGAWVCKKWKRKDGERPLGREATEQQTDRAKRPGVRQSPAAIASPATGPPKADCVDRDPGPSESGRGLPHSKTLREGGVQGEGLAAWEIGLRVVAAILVILAAGQTALHLVPPRLRVSERTTATARKHIVAPKELKDFDALSTHPCWQGKRLKTLLEHVELASYNRELINWTLDEQVYRDFVLSPEIAPEADGDLNWRRPLWESFYPRIRKEPNTQAAAEIIARYLRERVTVAEGPGFPGAISEIWLRQITNPRGFECIYVAALRSAGVPARLDARRQAEFWTGSEWRPAPRPIW
jgi:hypothetical protein